MKWTCDNKTFTTILDLLNYFDEHYPLQDYKRYSEAEIYFSAGPCQCINVTITKGCNLRKCEERFLRKIWQVMMFRDWVAKISYKDYPGYIYMNNASLEILLLNLSDFVENCFQKEPDKPQQQEKKEEKNE